MAIPDEIIKDAIKKKKSGPSGKEILASATSAIAKGFGADVPNKVGEALRKRREARKKDTLSE